MILFGFLGIILSYLNVEELTNINPTVFILILTYLLFKYIMKYPVKSDKFYKLNEIKEDLEKISETTPEMIVITIEDKTQVVPLDILVSSELILTNQTIKYSLSFCALCNSVHAYHLPEIGGEKILISSHGGSVMNGNKVLYDETGKYIWQQITGKPLSNAAMPYPLKEINTNRYLLQHVVDLFPDAEYYYNGHRFIQHYYYKLIGFLVRKLSFFKFTTFKYDKALPAKMLVAGLTILGVGGKVYPMTLFKPGEIVIFEDSIGDREFTILFNGNDVIAFDCTGIELNGEELIFEGTKYNLAGISESGNLNQLIVTGNVYWYLFNQMYPECEIYRKSGEN